MLRCERLSKSMRGIDSYTCPLHATVASPMILAPRRSEVNTKLALSTFHTTAWIETDTSAARLYASKANKETSAAKSSTRSFFLLFRNCPHCDCATPLNEMENIVFEIRRGREGAQYLPAQLGEGAFGLRGCEGSDSLQYGCRSIIMQTSRSFRRQEQVVKW